MTEPSASCLYCFCPRRTGNTWSKRRPASCCQNRNIGSRLFVESPRSMTFFASCICLPSTERRLCEFLGNVPKSRCPCRGAGLGHDQGRRRGASQFADSARSIIGAGHCFRARRREQDRSGSVGRRLTKKRSGEIACKRKQTARTARQHARPGKSRMGRIAGQVPAGRVTPPLQFKRKHQHRELGLPIRLPWRVCPHSLQIIEIDERGSVCQAADIYDACPARPGTQWHQPSRESKVTQIVCSKLHLKAVCRGLPARQRHHSCIVYQKIQRLPGMHPLRKIGDGREVGQIERLVA